MINADFQAIKNLRYLCAIEIVQLSIPSTSNI